MAAQAGGQAMLALTGGKAEMAVLARFTRLQKQAICSTYIGEHAAQWPEVRLNDLLREKFKGTPRQLETGITRMLINMAFDLIDANGDGELSRIEVLTGVRSKPAIRDMLNMRFATPGQFNHIFDAIDADGSDSIDRKEWEAYFMHKLLHRSWSRSLLLLLPTNVVLRWWRPFKARGYIFLKDGRFNQVWEWLVAFAALYSTVYVPLALVFVQARWNGHVIVDGIVDGMLILDVLIRFRTSYHDRGYNVTSARRIASNYLRGWFFWDVMSSFPFSSLAAINAPEHAAGVRVVHVTPLEWLSLFRVLAVGRIARMMSKVTSSQTVRRMPTLAVFLPVTCLMYMFVLMAHYLGLLYHMIAIRPLETDSSYDDDQDWFWVESSPDYSPTYSFAIRYICSLYWALSVMTNLKGLPVHESRQCLWRSSLVVFPLEERVYTILVFIIGASFFSAIYGNIAQFISNLYASNFRYQRCMEEVDEFSRFYRITPDLSQRIRHYADFHWSVTRGINIEQLAGGLPKHLQLEIQLQLNRPMLEKVSIFNGLQEVLIERLVSRLQLITVIAGENVFFKGQTGTRMFFIQRGTAHVIEEGAIIATLGEGDYFGEMALLSNCRRTSDVLAHTDLILMALAKEDMEAVLQIDPRAKERMERNAKRRLSELKPTHIEGLFDKAEGDAELGSFNFRRMLSRRPPEQMGSRPNHRLGDQPNVQQQSSRQSHRQSCRQSCRQSQRVSSRHRVSRRESTERRIATDTEEFSRPADRWRSAEAMLVALGDRKLDEESRDRDESPVLSGQQRIFGSSRGSISEDSEPVSADAPTSDPKGRGFGCEPLRPRTELFYPKKSKRLSCDMDAELCVNSTSATELMLGGSPSADSGGARRPVEQGLSQQVEALQRKIEALEKNAVQHSPRRARTQSHELGFGVVSSWLSDRFGKKGPERRTPATRSSHGTSSKSTSPTPESLNA